MEAPVDVRSAKSDDGAALEALLREGWTPGVTPAGTYEPRPFFDRYATDEVLVAVFDNLPVGYVVVRPASSMTSHAHVWTIDGLGVGASARRRGVAGALLRDAERVAAGAGCTRVTLHVLGCNSAALSLYERHGYTIEGRLRNEFRLPVGAGATDVYVDDLLLAKSLSGERPTCGR